MNQTAIANRIATHLDVLCNRIGDRPTGSPANREATTYVRSTLESLGPEVSYPAFPCIDWEGGSVTLRVRDETYTAHASPYSLPFAGRGRLATASSVDELRRKDIGEAILLIHGDLASEPLFPKGFVFYNPEEHQEIIRILEERKPAAIIAATGRAPLAAGAPYPFPVFIDGDFDIPSVFMKDVDGERLRLRVGDVVDLAFDARRIPSAGHNVIATMPSPIGHRIVLTAHVDTHKGTPGALDDGSGVATLLAIAELLHGRAVPLTVEFALLNGEDYYAASGEMTYLAANEDRWQDIRLAVNVDDAGYREGKTAYSFYECPDPLKGSWERVLGGFGGLTPGEQWVQGDHSIFVQKGVPAVAFISDQGEYLMREFVHTDKDRIGLVDPLKLAELAEAVAQCVISV